MLRARVFLVLLVAVALGTATPAFAAGGVDCPPDRQYCFVTVGTSPSAPAAPASGATNANGGSIRECVNHLIGEVVPCYDPIWGWFNNLDECYYRLVEPAPAPSSRAWEGHYPDGAVYEAMCFFFTPGTNGGWVWLPTPPGGFGAASVTPGELAAQAVDQMALTGPEIGLTITGDELGMVGLPVWLWTNVSPTTWGPNSATAAVPGLSVMATADAVSIAWDMGDGGSVRCANPGTPYIEGQVHSPSCEYVYTKTSAGQPDEAFTITGTTTWHVAWSGGGTSGALTVTRSATTRVRIGELQVLVTA